MFRGINTISVLKVFWEPDLKKARKASQLANVLRKNYYILKEHIFKGFFLLASIPNESMN